MPETFKQLYKIAFGLNDDYCFMNGRIYWLDDDYADIDDEYGPEWKESCLNDELWGK